MNLFFQVKSSSGDFYTVSVHHRDGLVYLKCNCQAGSYMKFCKHKFAVARGDESILLEPSGNDDWATAQTWIRATGFPEILEDCFYHEQIVETHQKELKRLRAKLEHCFKAGLS
jgi:hypothetical protein